MIKEIIVLNGGKEYHFIVGEDFGGAKIRKIELVKGKYIAFLEKHREVEVNCQDVFVVYQY